MYKEMLESLAEEMPGAQSSVSDSAIFDEEIEN